MSKDPIRVAIVGIGNCASSMVQGYFYYNQWEGEGPPLGVMNWNLGGYTPRDILPVAAFDVDRRKIGKDITSAIFEGPNCAIRYDCDLEPLNVPVNMGPVFDGVAEWMDVDFQPSEKTPVEVGQVLKDTGAEVMINFLPAASDKATSYYADQAINVAKIGFVNGMPSPVANDPTLSQEALNNACPLIGDDIKSQLGGTIAHRALIDCLNSRGITIEKTYQLNYAGNTDFRNQVGARVECKHQSKRQGIGAFLESGDLAVGATPMPNMGDRKTTIFHFEGYNYGGAPLTLKAILEVEDSPNFAGSMSEAVRYCKIARDRGIGGVLESASAFLMKSPPSQIPDHEAQRNLREFVDGIRER